MSSRLLLASLCSAMTVLAGCGGGGNGNGVAAPTPESAAPAPSADGGSNAETGSVSAAFVPGDSPKRALFGVSRETAGNLLSDAQSPGGAVTSINDLTLGAPATVRDISGDATFAMGRWAAGTVTGGTSPETLTESGSAAYHYVLFNAPASLPSSGALTCDAGTFTTPTYAGGTAVSGQSDYLGHLTGSAQLAFSSSGAAVQLDLTVSNSVSSGANSFSTVVPPSAALSLAGHGIGANVPHAWVGLGASGTGYDIVGGYDAATNSGSIYTGVYRFHCQ